MALFEDVTVLVGSLCFLALIIYQQYKDWMCRRKLEQMMANIVENGPGKWEE